MGSEVPGFDAWCAGCDTPVLLTALLWEKLLFEEAVLEELAFEEDPFEELALEEAVLDDTDEDEGGEEETVWTGTTWEVREEVAAELLCGLLAGAEEDSWLETGSFSFSRRCTVTEYCFLSLPSA